MRDAGWSSDHSDGTIITQEPPSVLGATLAKPTNTGPTRDTPRDLAAATILTALGRPLRGIADSDKVLPSKTAVWTVLAISNEPMSSQRIYEEAVALNLVNKAKGTLNNLRYAIITELSQRCPPSIFTLDDCGRVGLRDWEVAKQARLGLLPPNAPMPQISLVSPQSLAAVEKDTAAAAAKKRSMGETAAYWASPTAKRSQRNLPWLSQSTALTAVTVAA